jgi:hypothetical protein
MVCVHIDRRIQSPSGTARGSFGGLRLFSLNMQRHSFSKRQLTAIALMLDEEEKNAALSDKKKRMWIHKCFRSRKPEGEYWTLYKELADDKMKFFFFFPDTVTVLLV